MNDREIENNAREMLDLISKHGDEFVDCDSYEQDHDNDLYYEYTETIPSGYYTYCRPDYSPYVTVCDVECDGLHEVTVSIEAIKEVLSSIGCRVSALEGRW